MNNFLDFALLPYGWPMKVFVDSPLAVNATNVFREHVECYDDEMLEQIMIEEDEIFCVGVLFAANTCKKRETKISVLMILYRIA